uniref:uncharacterized protein LOC114582828 isoform X1 n=1 Tax=Podarcis muralis TaxID=64176 RepID=UPI00109F6BB5|nr:uncharacterized protein LOC114582828 isoform X1 [Podarcis muralis]
MTTPEDPWAKEPLEEGGEKLKAKEAGRSTEKKGGREEGEREEDPLLKFQWPRWLKGGGRQKEPLEEGEKLKTEEAGRTTEKKGGKEERVREVGYRLMFQRFLWLVGGGRPKEPLEEEGEMFKVKETGKFTEKKGEREVDSLLKFQGSQWLEGGGRQSSSSSSDDDDDWDLNTSGLPHSFAQQFHFEDQNLFLALFCIARFLQFSLRRLIPEERRRFRRKLREIPLEEGFLRIPDVALHKAGAPHLRDLLLSYYGGVYAIEVAAKVLSTLGRKLEVDKLLFSVREEYSAMSHGMQRNVRKNIVWSLEGVVITGDEMFCKGRKELLEIIEKDVGFFIGLLSYGFIITRKEYWDFWKAGEDSKEKSQKLLNMIQERGEATCCWFLEEVERKHPGSIQILLVAVHGSGKKLVQGRGPSGLKSESPLFAEEGRSSKVENPAVCGESVVCNLCPCEQDLPETIRPEVFLDSETSHESYRLCFTKAGSFLCFYTDVIFEVRGAVTITYHFDSWSKHLAEQNTEDWVVAGPLINIEADPAEAVAAVHFPHFLCLAGKSDSQVHIAHFVEGGMSLEKPDRVGPYHVVLENPNFSPRGAILRTSWSWFKRKIKVHTVALLYQMLRFSSPKFHLYLLPNDSSLRKAVHEHEAQCPSQRIDKPPGTLRPLTIGCHFFVETNDVRVCPKEVEFQYLDADKLQQYVELFAQQMQDMFNFSVMEKPKNELIWEALVTQEELKSPEMTSSPSSSEQGACCFTMSHAASGHSVESRAMKKTIRDHLVFTLENLREDDLNRFKFKLSELPIAECFDNIPQGPLEKANAMELSRLLLGFYMEDYAVQVTVDVLNAINCRDEAERLLSLTRKRLE